MTNSTPTSEFQVRNDGTIYWDNQTGQIGTTFGQPYAGPQISSIGANWMNISGSSDLGSTSAGVVINYYSTAYSGWRAALKLANTASSYSNLLLMQDGGNVGIGITNPSYTLHVVGTAGLSTGTAWTNASDIRLKDIHGDYEYGLDEVLKLHTVRFTYKKDNPLGLPADHPMTGFIAQEVQKVIPDAVHENKNGYLELNVDPIHWAVVNAVKELKQFVDGINERLAGHDQAIADQARDIASLKAASEAKTAKLETENEMLKQDNAAIKAYLCGKDPSAAICQ